MGRKLKLLPVGEVSLHNMMGSRQVFYDRNTQEFVIELAAGVEVRAASESEVKQEAQKKSRELIQYDFKPVIRIFSREENEKRYWTRNERFDLDAELRIAFCRLEVSPHPNPKVIRPIDRVHTLDVPEDWDDDLLLRWDRGELQSSNFPSLNTIEIPYDQEIWDRLVELHGMVEQASRVLLDLITRAEKKPELLKTLRGKLLKG